MADVKAPRTISVRPKKFRDLKQAEMAFNELLEELSRAYQLLVGDVLRINPVGGSSPATEPEVQVPTDSGDLLWRQIEDGANFKLQKKIGGTWTTIYTWYG